MQNGSIEKFPRRVNFLAASIDVAKHAFRLFLTNNSNLCNWDAAYVCIAQNGSVEESLHSVNFLQSQPTWQILFFFDCFCFNSRPFCVVGTP